jgi:hypothetical protein
LQIISQWLKILTTINLGKEKSHHYNIFFKYVPKFDENMKASQDYDLWIRILKHTEVGVLSEPYINYYNFSGNNQISNKTNKYIESFDIINKKYEYEISLLSKFKRNERKYFFYLSLSKYSMRNNEKKNAIKFSFYALQNKLSILGLLYMIFSIFNYSIILRLRKIKNWKR